MAQLPTTSPNDTVGLRSAWERYLRVFENSPDGILLFHAGSASILDLNPRAAEMLGYSREEATAFRLDEFPPFEPNAGRRILEACENGRALYWEEPLASKAGGAVECEILGTVYWENGHRAVQLNLRRIVTRKLERLAGGVAHRFNNLLTGIMGNASLLADDIPLGSRNAALLEEVLTAAAQGANLTQNLLSYAGLDHFTPENFSLSDLILETARQFDPLIPPRVRVRLEPTLNLPPVMADRRQIQQVIFSLVLNGAEAISGDGTVQVRAFAKALAPSDLHEFLMPRAFSVGRCVCLEVEDTGKGIPERIQPQIFDPFFSTKFTGRGLGLAAVAGIVRRHGGHIQVESGEGRGSVFRVLLPVASGAAAAAWRRYAPAC